MDKYFSMNAVKELEEYCGVRLFGWNDRSVILEKLSSIAGFSREKRNARCVIRYPRRLFRNPKADRVSDSGELGLGIPVIVNGASEGLGAAGLSISFLWSGKDV